MFLNIIISFQIVEFFSRYSTSNFTVVIKDIRYMKLNVFFSEKETKVKLQIISLLTTMQHNLNVTT